MNYLIEALWSGLIKQEMSICISWCAVEPDLSDYKGFWPVTLCGQEEPKQRKMEEEERLKLLKVKLGLTTSMGLRSLCTAAGS